MIILVNPGQDRGLILGGAEPLLLAPADGGLYELPIEGLLISSLGAGWETYDRNRHGWWLLAIATYPQEGWCGKFWNANDWVRETEPNVETDELEAQDDEERHRDDGYDD